MKHVGGSKAKVIAKEFSKAGINCFTHRLSRTTELCHIMNNSAYGAELIFADEMAKLCRAYGVDYHNIMKYTETHNRGFTDLDHARFVRPILMPPNGKIGGHCVTQGATLIPEELRGPILDYLSHYEKLQAAGKNLRIARCQDRAAEIESANKAEASKITAGEPHHATCQNNDGSNVQDLRPIVPDLHMDKSRDTKNDEAAAPSCDGSVGPC